MGGSARPASLARRPASCDAGFASLQSYGIGPGVVGPGQPVVVELEWSAGSRSPPLDPPVVFAHLVGPLDDDAPGRVVATDDGAPSSGDWPWRMAQPPAWGAFDRHVLATAAGTPRGVYAVEVGLYDRVTGTRYPVSCPMADTAERRIRLGTVLIR
jgi:hypothetical protein